MASILFRPQCIKDSISGSGVLTVAAKYEEHNLSVLNDD